MFAALGQKLVGIVEEEGEIRTLWEYEVQGQIPGSPVLGEDGNLRVHSGDGRLHCVSRSGEEVFRPAKVGEPLGWASPVVDGDGATWVCAFTGGLLKVEPDGTCRREPFFRTRQKLDSTGFVHQRVFYVGAEDGFVYAVSLEGRKGRNLFKHAAGQGKTEWFINSSPAMSPDSTLVVAGRDEYLYGFALDGKPLWKLHIRGQMLASPVVDASGDVYVGVTLDKMGKPVLGKLLCINGRTHRVRWEYPARASVESTPVIGNDDVIYFGDNSGTIHAVGTDGRGLYAVEVGSPVRSAGTIPAANRLVFGLDNGTLVALACSSKALAGDAWPKYMGALEQSGMV